MGTAFAAGDPMSQELAGWNPSTKSVDSDWLPNRGKVAARVRDLVRNDGWAAGGITRYLDSVVGADLRLSAKPDFRALGFDADWAAEFSDAVESEWRSWADDIQKYSDATRHSAMGGLFSLAFRHKLMEGDALALSHWLPERGGKYATTIQVVSPQRLSNPFGAPDSNALRGGVVRDEFGAATAYYFRNAHPGDSMMMGEGDFDWTRIERETSWGRPLVIHHFDREESGQTRGVGRLTPVVERLKMLSRYDKVELQAAVLNAILAAYIVSPFDHAMLENVLASGDDAELSAYQNERLEFHDNARVRLNGVRIPTLFPGEDIKGIDSTRPNTAFADFETQALRNVASGIGLSYEQLSADWSKTNYSSARAALLEVWRTFTRDRMEFTRSFCAPIYGLFLEELFDRGLVPLPAGAPDFWEEKTAYCRAKWIGPPRGWVDPMKEAGAAKLRMEVGLSTLEDEAAEQGKDWEEIIVQRARERKMWAENGLPDPQMTAVINTQEQDQ